MAHGAWQKAMDFDRDVLSALAEVEQLSKMVIQWTALLCGIGSQRRAGELEGRDQFSMVTCKGHGKNMSGLKVLVFVRSVEEIHRKVFIEYLRIFKNLLSSYDNDLRPLCHLSWVHVVNTLSCTIKNSC